MFYRVGLDEVNSPILAQYDLDYLNNRMLNTGMLNSRVTGSYSVREPVKYGVITYPTMCYFIDLCFDAQRSGQAGRVVGVGVVCGLWMSSAHAD